MDMVAVTVTFFCDLKYFTDLAQKKTVLNLHIGCYISIVLTLTLEIFRIESHKSYLIIKITTFEGVFTILII